MSRRILIVGGVAAGASTATRLRRLDEQAEIVVFERGPHVSFAGCGLPYHVGDVIPDAGNLLLVSPATFRERFAIDVRVGHEVVGVDRQARTVQVRQVATGELRTERYDALVLATGAAPVVPPFVPRELPGVFTLRGVPDASAIREWIRARDARRAVVVGAGFIGLETTENLRRLGVEVTVVERLDQVMATLDPEIARPVAERLRERGVRLMLGTSVQAVRAEGTALVVETAGEALPADLVVLALGVRPEVGLARAMGLELGSTGGIKVDDGMRTTDPAIYAVGDAIETRCAVTGAPMLLPLAGPATRQARVAADNLAGRPTRFRGVQGSAICEVFGLSAASTGLTEKRLQALGHTRYGIVRLFPSDHVTWFPGSATLTMKVLYDLDSGRLLGAEAVGEAGVDKRIDVVAMAIQTGATVYDLEDAELCYAPQVGAPRDAVNVAAMIAANELRGDAPPARWEALPDDGLLVDVREVGEFARGHVPGALNLPLSRLRERMHELPRDRPVLVYCQSGKRSYNAMRALRQGGWDARSVGGGIASWALLGPVGEAAPLER